MTAVRASPALLVCCLAVVAAGATWAQLVSVAALVLLSAVALCGVALVALGQRAVHFLGQDEQLRVEGFTGVTVRNGPCVAVLNPFAFRSTEVRTAETLGQMDYAKVRDTGDGSERIEKGPRLLFLGPYEKLVQKGQAISLGNTDYLIVEDKLSGERRVVQGPCMWFPGPHDDPKKGTAVSLSRTEFIIVEDRLTGDKTTVRGPRVWFPKPFDSPSSKQTAVALQEDEYLRMKDTASGQRWVQKGKALIFLEPTWKIEGTNVKDPTGVRKAWSLKAYQFVRLVDSVTGKVTTHKGEQTVFPGPDEELLDGCVQEALDLKVHEYVKILDQATSEVRVERCTSSSSKLVFLGPNDRVLGGGKQKAIAVDEDHAVLVRDKASGQLRLITEKSLFVPAANESIEEVRERIKLSDHEAMIIKDKDGQYQYYYGSDEKRSKNQSRSFFLPPYAEIVQLCWSKGRRRESRSLLISRFDCRPQFMSFEFNCRTSDNVELVLEGTFFWEVVDLPAMVKSTGDTSGDLCNHARSQFIRHVAHFTLKQFMDELHNIARKVWEEDTKFYESRGVKIHSLEVTRYQCADQSTSEILEQIIQETTNRMNRLSQAESENEVNLFRTQGQIEQEKMNGELLKIQYEHSESEAEVTGRAEAARISAFVEGLNESGLKLDEKVALWQVLRKNDALSVVSKGGASLYYTPSDVDLSIDTRPQPQGKA